MSSNGIPMSLTGIPWQEEPEYVAACRTQLQPGEPSTYTRLAGGSPTDVTGFQIGSAYWNIDNLPNVCYVLNPPVEWDVFRTSPRPIQKRDELGRAMWERHPWPGTAARPLLDFPILRNIDTICTQVGWEWLEFIMRLDPRLTWDDIDMRMEYVGGRAAHNHTIHMASNDVTKQALKAKTKFVNALQTRCSRGRVAFKMLSWRERTRTSNKSRDDVLRQLSADQIANNTTRGSTPGIINPLLPNTPANRVPHRGTQSQPSTPSNAQSDVQADSPARMLAASHQASPSSTDAAAPPQPYMHQTAPPYLDRLRVPLTMPSTQPSHKQKASAISPTPLVNNDTSSMDNKPLTLTVKRAKRNFIDLTQDDETHSDAESLPSNHASTWTPYTDTNMRASGPNAAEPNSVHDTVLDSPPTGILNRTRPLSSPFPFGPVPTASIPTTITQPLSEPTAPTEQESAAVNDPNQEQGWDVFYRDEDLAPFTEVGQEYLDWRYSGPGSFPC